MVFQKFGYEMLGEILECGDDRGEGGLNGYLAAESEQYAYGCLRVLG